MRYLVALFVVAVAIASVPIGMVVWPPAAGTPPHALLPFFVFVGLCEGASLGAGLAWLALGHRLLGPTRAHAGLRAAAHLSIGWLFVNWWAHDGLHRSAFGQTFAGVALIDVVFHTTLIAATAVTAAYIAVAMGAGKARAGRGERIPADAVAEA